MNELVLTLVIGGRRTALRAPDVHSVVELGKVSPVPRAPDFVRGLTALRSAAMTVIDCAVALGLPSREGDPEGRRAAVFEDQGHLYALLVDEVDDVVESHTAPTPVPGDAGSGWELAALGMIETASGPALLIDPSIFIRSEICTKAA
jgi:chemotaxis signal transduction protein